MQKRRGKPIVTEQQKALLLDLRKRFAECGHLVLLVSRVRRRHKFDFLAVPKSNPLQFLIVEPDTRGRVRVRPFGCRTLYIEAKRAVAAARAAHKNKVRWHTQIPICKHNLRLEHYLTPTGMKELKRITGYAA